MTAPSSANDNGNGGADPKGQRIGQHHLRPVLPKRFYQAAAVTPFEGGHAVTLDGRAVKTPAKAPLVLVSAALAQAVAAEWAAQDAVIDPAAMPLTRLANTAIDAVAKSAPAVAADIIAFAGTDALLYRAESPAELADRQRASWDPVLAWAERTFAARLTPAIGIRHVAQPPDALAAVARALQPHDPWRLAPLHVMTTLTGSALLALAVAHGAMTAEEAWAAAHVDEDWQIETWGQDAEADARRRARRTEMRAAALFLELIDAA